MNYRKKVILAKLESPYGTDAVPAGATDALLVRNCQIDPVAANLVDRELVRGYYGHSEQIPVDAGVRIQFEVEMVGSGALGTAPQWGKLLEACGFAETVNAGVSVEYDPVSETFDSLSIYYHQDGLRHKALGCRGTFGLRMSPRGIPVFAFDFMGLHVAPTDTALASPTLTAWRKPVAVNNANTTAFALHAHAGKCYDFSIDLANLLTHRNLIGGEDVLITDRAPTGSIEIETPAVATKDYFTIAKAGTLGALTITHGPATDRVKVDLPAVQLINPQYTDRDGVLGIRMGLRAVPTAAGNDEITITSL